MDAGAAGRGRESFHAAVLVGVGVVAALDEIVLHQLLQWHHFIDFDTPVGGLVSDGLLHSAELIALVAGFSLLLGLRREGALGSTWAWAGFWVGVGGFQLFDGIVNHKILRLHQIRYVEEVLAYDLAWNVAAIVILAAGLTLLQRARRAR